jgi:hypothetical protein
MDPQIRLNKWRDARKLTKSKVMVFNLRSGESCSVPAKDRRNAWTPGGNIIDQGTYSTQGVAHQEDGSWKIIAQKAPAKCKQPMGTTAVMQQFID